MIRNYVLLLLIVFSQFIDAQVSRANMAIDIYQSVYGQNISVNNNLAVNYPNPFLDLQGSTASYIPYVNVLSHLEYGDGISVIDRNTILYLPNQNVSRGEMVRAVMEAFNLPIASVGSASPYSDVPNPFFSEYYHIVGAWQLGLIPTSTNFLPYDDATSGFYLSLINNIFANYSTPSVNQLNNPNNYFAPNTYTPETLGFPRGLEQGVFSHYAKNSFSIPDIKLNLGFSHYYSTSMVEMPENYFPIQPLGRGWTHSYNSYIVRENNVGPNSIDYYNIIWPNGTVHVYNEDDDEYVSKGVFDELSELNGDRIRITTKDQMRYYFEQLDQSENIYYLNRIRDRNDNEITITYEVSDVDNDFRRILNVQSPSGKQLTFTYHQNSDLIDQITDPINRNIRFTFSSQYDRLKRFYDAKNQDTRYYYLALDDNAPADHEYRRYLMDEIRLPMGNRIKAEYDDNGNGKLKEYQLNNNTPVDIDVQYLYGTSEPIQATLDVPMPDGGMQVHNYRFNEDAVLTHFDNDIHTLNISYPSSGNPALSILPTTTNLNGVDIDYEYDSRGNITEIQKAGITDEDFFYNSENDLIQYEDANNNDTFFNYDNNGNLTSIIDALGNSTNFTYDNFGQMTSMTNPEGITVNYAYEPDGAISTINAPENISSSFTYDGINRLLSKNVNGLTSSYLYDNNDNLIQHTNSGSFITTFDYDQNDNLTKITNANGIDTDFAYNSKDQLISETFNGLVKQYQYNSDGTLDRYIKPSGAQINYDYTGDGQFNDGGIITDVDYDNRGRVEEISASGGKYEYLYDDLNRVVSVRDTYDNINDDIDYFYDDVGNMTILSYPGTPHRVLYDYDAKNRLTRVSQYNSSNPIPVVDYSYRDDDLLETITYSNGIVGTYTYDNAGRKTGISYSDNNGIIFSETVVLDNRGNILSDTKYYRDEEPNPPFYHLPNQNYSYDNNNHIQNASGVVFNVDNDGNTTVRGTPHIPPLAQADNANINYDIEDNLIGISGSNLPGYNRTYKYDAYGNRIETNIGGNVTKYTWDVVNNNVLVIDSQNQGFNLHNFYGATGLEYSIYGNSGNGGKIFYLGDLRGSVVVTIDENLPPANQFDFYKYDDFGNRLTSNSFGSLHQVYRYLGKHGVTLEEVLSGHYYIKARHYDSQIGRFFTEDPIWSTNLYPYSNNNPISYYDRNGKNYEDFLNNLSADFGDFIDNDVLRFYSDSQKEKIYGIVQLIAEGKHLGTGFFDSSNEYYQDLYIERYLNNDDTFTASVGVAATSLWTSQNHLAVLGAITLRPSDPKLMTTLFGKTGFLKILDMRSKSGLAAKDLYVTAKFLYDIISRVNRL